MSDETVVFLSAIGRISTRETLSTVLARQWKWESRYGDELYRILHSADIPVMKQLPKKTRGTKRSGEDIPQQPGVFVFQAIQTPAMGGTSSSRVGSSSQPQKRTRTAITRTDADQVPAHEASANYVPSMAQQPPYTPNQLYGTIPPQAYDPRNWFPYTGTINPYFAPTAPNPTIFQFQNTFGDPNPPPN
jgi:hypothetical protein